MRGWHLIPLALVVLVAVGLPVAAFTDSGVETDVRDALGVDSGECEPMTNEDSAWQEGPALPIDLDEPRGATIDGKIYLTGGITDLEVLPDDRLLLEPSDTLFRFDPRSGEYAELAPMPRALNHMGVTTYGGDLYVLGGYGKTLDAETSKAFFRYEVEADRWSRMPDLPRPLAAMGLGIVGDRRSSAAAPATAFPSPTPMPSTSGAAAGRSCRRSQGRGSTPARSASATGSTSSAAARRSRSR